MPLAGSTQSASLALRRCGAGAGTHLRTSGRQASPPCAATSNERDMQSRPKAAERMGSGWVAGSENSGRPTPLGDSTGSALGSWRCCRAGDGTRRADPVRSARSATAEPARARARAATSPRLDGASGATAPREAGPLTAVADGLERLACEYPDFAARFAARAMRRRMWPVGEHRLDQAREAQPWPPPGNGHERQLGAEDRTRPRGPARFSARPNGVLGQSAAGNPT
jgi:hypothetical protein